MVSVATGFLSGDDFEDLRQNNLTWANISCSVLPTVQQTFDLSAETYVVTYNPPMPYLLNPAAIKDL